MQKDKTKFINPAVESDSIQVLSLKLIELTKELEAKNEALANAERERKEMLANISHDLRAPITAIRSALDLLSSYEEVPKDELKNITGLLNRRVATLESLIQDMYFLFCVEDESRKFNLEDVSVAPFIESYFYDAIIDSRYDSHDMNLDMAEDLDATINIDIQKTIRVLDNLFTNSAKYSGDGSSITLSCHIDTEDASFVDIVVSDNGIGIPPEAVSHVFDRTYTVSSARTPGATAGSGLGLAICRAVTEKQNGTITCQSVLQKGCTFIIKLPIVK